MSPPNLHLPKFSNELLATPSAWSGRLAPLLRIAAISAPLLVLAACGKAGGAGPGGPGGMPPPEVNVVTVQPTNLPMDFEYVGQTAGSRETEVRARISGILENRLYEEGSRVKAGTVLFQIDPGTYKTQLASAEAAAGVNEAKLNQAKREFARLTPLAAEKAISQKEFDDAKSALETAEASYKQSMAQVNEAKLNLGYTRVVAPIDGVTGIASKSNGSLVTASDSLLTTIVQTDPVYVNFSITEADYLKLSQEVSGGKIALPGKRATNGSLAFDVKVKLADGSIFPMVGKMNFASEKVNPATGGFDARAQIPNPDGTLRPGQFVRVILNGATRTAALSVPQRAVIDSPMGKIVFTVTPDNKLAPRPVELDGWSNGEWIVTKGLKGGDRVLVDGFIKAHEPGMTVTPVPLAAKPSGSAGSSAPTSAPAQVNTKPAAETASTKAAQ
ncbi:membrane fusion protein (multidrug efflux system) [Undibacterium sp. GrIS 1.8]|uniref:efflux RND transporter periplasmic adaptor subunit n=1 Tax=unclassified Undibacterium TaxID=2630295 RepID=UPI00339A7715